MLQKKQNEKHRDVIFAVTNSGLPLLIVEGTPARLSDQENYADGSVSSW
jgi:hypothetical protein